MPIEWRELDQGIDLRRAHFNVRNAGERLATRKSDPGGFRSGGAVADGGDASARRRGLTLTTVAGRSAVQRGPRRRLPARRCACLPGGRCVRGHVQHAALCDRSHRRRDRCQLERHDGAMFHCIAIGVVGVLCWLCTVTNPACGRDRCWRQL